MAKFEAYAYWLFADSVADNQPCEMQFVETKPYENGKGQVLYFLGKKGNLVGDFRCFPSAIKNFKELLQKLGDDDTKWQGKIFSVQATEDKKKLVLTLL